MTANMSEEVCRDFENGRCIRGNGCKFFHPKLSICKDFQNKGCDRVKCKFLHILREDEQNYETSGVLPEHMAGEIQSKRPNGVESQGYGMYGKRRREESYMMPEMPAMPAMSPALHEENDFLRRKISDLQHQILDLRQMNDTLYDQNTRYRNQLRSSTSISQAVDPYSKTAVGISAVGSADVTSKSYYEYN